MKHVLQFHLKLCVQKWTSKSKSTFKKL